MEQASNLGRSEGWLRGRVAIVTGGGTGIGEAICKVFAQHGASVLVNGLPGDPVEDVAREIAKLGGSAAAHTGDVGTVDGSEACVQAALSIFGKLDVVVANAGVLPKHAPIEEAAIEDFEQVLHSNVRGVYLIGRASVRELRKTKGSFIALGSEAGLVGQEQAVAYGASKGFVTAFTRGLAAEQAKYGVRANVVAPGPIDTEMTRPSKGNMTVKHALMAVAGTALGRRGTPEEVANVCLFLASDFASFVTGAIYTVDGGATAAAAGVPGLQAKREAKQAPEGTVPLEHQYEGRGDLGG